MWGRFEMKIIWFDLEDFDEWMMDRGSSDGGVYGVADSEEDAKRVGQDMKVGSVYHAYYGSFSEEIKGYIVDLAEMQNMAVSQMAEEFKELKQKYKTLKDVKYHQLEKELRELLKPELDRILDDIRHRMDTKISNFVYRKVKKGELK